MEKRRATSDERRAEGAKRKKKSRAAGGISYRLIEQERMNSANLNRRKNKEHRIKEQKSNTASHNIRRQNKEYRTKEQERDKTAHQKCLVNFRSNWVLLENKYRTQIQECADYVCASCGGLFYKKSGHVADEDLTRCATVLITNLSSYMQNGRLWFCVTCTRSLKNKKIPLLCLQNGFQFPRIPEILRCLTPLEEMLVALRLPFMQIRSLGSDRQSGLFGSVVNVPNDLEICTSVIPRNFDDTGTVQVMLKRQIKSKNHVLYETVRPYVVHTAAKYLMKTELYQSEGVVLSEHWCNSSENDIENFTPHSQEVAPGIEQEPDSSSDDEELEQVNPGTQETLLLPPDDFAEMIVKIAPGEGKIPLSIIRDVHAEVLSFPTIYGGIQRTFKEGLKVTYTDIAKSEIRNADRRACKPTKILYSYKLMLLSRVAEAIQICLRKKRKLDGRPVTAGQLRNQEFVANLIQHDDGFRMLKTIRSSPAYWESQDKKVFAMIRQVCIPAFFVTVSAAETKWLELIRQLCTVKHKKEISTTEISKLTWAERAELIRNDPVTCAQHYDHRFRAFLNNLVKPIGGIFSPLSVTDWYCRYEFQLRGSLHTHMLIWIPEAPKFKGDETNFEELVKYIDTYVTCEREDDGDFGNLVQYQIHKHSHTCRRKIQGRSSCRFNFPKPPMPDTVILPPLSKEFSGLKNAKTDYQTLQEVLVNMGRNYKENIDFDTFLLQLGWTKERYLTAVQSSIKNSAIFLKRRTCDIYINNYNKKILTNWGANMDIQFVLDGFACAKYVVSYINKSSGGVAKLLRKANEEIRLGNINLRDRLRKFGNIFNNFSQISQQEAAVGLLGIPLVNCSRSDIYINTSLPNERTFMVKSKKELEELPEESEDIAASSLIDKYADRPDELESTSLASFGAYWEYCKTNPSKVAMRLKSLPGYVVKRRDAKIIRFRNYGEQSDPCNYYREQLMLYVPWRSEESLLCEGIEQLYRKHQASIEQEKAKYVSGFSAEEFLKNATQELNEINDEIDAQPDPDIEFLYEEGMQTDFLREIGVDRKSSKIEHLLSPKLIDNEKYNAMLRSLNELQRKLLLHVLHLIKTNQLPFYHFMSGGAGVGKTHIILAMVQVLLRYFFKLPEQNLDSTFVLVCAPTGKAAFNVFGMTLHHCWRLPPNQYAGNLAKLDESECNTLRNKLLQLKLIIIDEVSMMSVQQLFQLNSRLKQIFNTECDFGGKSILVVGHFRQLPPVGGSPVFTIPKMYANMTSLPQVHGNYLWSRFSLFELVEIMRQKDDAKFCVALNNMAEGIMTAADIELLKSREISATNIPPDNAIRLFKFNEDCSEYNRKVHSNLPGETVISSAYDRIQGHGTQAQKEVLLQNAKTWSTGNADGLPLKVSLKEGALYFVSTNVDVSDGLFNGSTGQLKKIIFGVTSAGERTPLRVFLHFENSIVGSKLRSSMQNYQNLNKIDLTWTSIERYTRVLQKSGRNSKLQVVRTQIPLIASNGTTIHKSQGSSLKLVVLSLLRKLTRALIYVGCSRATSSSGLYLDGIFEAPEPPSPDDPVSLEMTRLRSSPLKLSLTFFTDVDSSVMKMMFHNVQSLNKNSMDVLSDHSFMAADILAFVEPWSLPMDSYNFPEFQIVQRADCATTRNSFGSMVFSKDPSSITAMKFEATNANPGHITSTIWMTDNLTIIMIYKSPKSRDSILLQYIKTTLKKLGNQNIVIVGDFNINLHDSESRRFQEVFRKYGLTSKLPECCQTTDGGSQLDWCFSNKNEVKAWIFESTWSYHKPICVTWPRANIPIQQKDISEPIVHTIQNEDMQIENLDTTAEPSSVSFEALYLEDQSEADVLLAVAKTTLLDLWKRYGTGNLLIKDVDRIQMQLNQQRDLMERCVLILANQPLATYIGQTIDTRSTKLLPKPFLEYYNAVDTAANGNCFYNALSLNLFGDEKYNPLIKLAILYDISKNELGYTHFLDNHASTYEKLVQTALGDKIYANEYIAYAASKVLQRPIHSYDMSFGESLMKNSKDFMQAMSNKRYVPHRYLLFDSKNAEKRPVCLHHRNMHDGGVKNHFVALLKKNDNAPVFPANQDYYVLFRQFGGTLPIN